MACVGQFLSGSHCFSIMLKKLFGDKNAYWASCCRSLYIVPVNRPGTKIQSEWLAVNYKFSAKNQIATSATTPCFYLFLNPIYAFCVYPSLWINTADVFSVRENSPRKILGETQTRIFWRFIDHYLCNLPYANKSQLEASLQREALVNFPCPFISTLQLPNQHHCCFVLNLGADLKQ